MKNILNKVLIFLHIVYYADSVNTAKHDYFRAIFKHRKRQALEAWDSLSTKEVKSAKGYKATVKAMKRSPYGESQAWKTGEEKILKKLASIENLYDFLYWFGDSDRFSRRSHSAFMNKLEELFLAEFRPLKSVNEINNFFRKRHRLNTLNCLPESIQREVDDKRSEFRKKEIAEAIDFDQKLNKMIEFAGTPEGWLCFTTIIQLIDGLEKAEAVLRVLDEQDLSHHELYDNVYLKYLEYLTNQKKLLSLLKRTKNGSKEEEIILRKLGIPKT